tara:strand:+ start:3328 stop:3921 length:594 start_codon:yes stop_codon:yes gene_type:complete
MTRDNTQNSPAIQPEDIYKIVPQQVIFDVLKQYRFDLMESEHAMLHWGRVIENGFWLAEKNGANKNVIIAFGIFHDCRRENEFDDPEHGPRGGEFLHSFADKINMTKGELSKAVEACKGHTHILHTDDIDIATCWDADRLDLMRVGIFPELKYLNNTSLIDDKVLFDRSQPAIFNQAPQWIVDILNDFQIHIDAAIY